MREKKDLLKISFDSKLDKVDLKAIYGGGSSTEITQKNEGTYNPITQTSETDTVPDQAIAGGGATG